MADGKVRKNRGVNTGNQSWYNPPSIMAAEATFSSSLELSEANF